MISPARIVSLGVPLLFLAALACSDATDISECHGQVDVVVTPGPPPVYSWTPACRISYLVVVDRGDQSQGFWSVSSGVGKKDIAPPVTHGVVPAHATEDAGTRPLQPGGAYLVILFLVDEDQNGEFVVTRAGEQAFNQ
jgi:hypothetical protein